MAENEVDTKRNMEELNEVMARWKMKINWGKTKVMVYYGEGVVYVTRVDGVEVDNSENVQTANIWGSCLRKKNHVMTKLKTESGSNENGWGIEQGSYCTQRTEQSH